MSNGFLGLAPEERIITALDMPRDEAIALADKLAGTATWLKVGMTLYYKDLIALRKANPWLFNGVVTGQVLAGNAIAASYTQDGKLVGYLVANPNDTAMTASLPDGAWEALWGAAGDFTGTLTVEGKTVVLLRLK